MRTPMQSRSETSAEQMVSAALALLEEGGVGAVTIAAVATRSGISNGALYHRFGDRSGLLRAAQDQVLGTIEAETADAFDLADAEPDDDRATRLLAQAALSIFAEHRGAMRAFLVETREQQPFRERTEQSSHLIGALVTGWLITRFDTSPADADAAYRMLFALGAAQALFDDAQVSPRPVEPGTFADAIARALSAVARRS
ncbi:MAG: TetR family transcriptional regulator [Actinobacteria bacterium]|uniref:Unannotated protein n=1 Tax=freshwater metagenome TaxID=449393 RepID=A0A6J6PNA1_9ZZZZ|nr:TetR family transcriptional regulator [Actinomycetota bacterium]